LTVERIEFGLLLPGAQPKVRSPELVAGTHKFQAAPSRGREGQVDSLHLRLDRRPAFDAKPRPHLTGEVDAASAACGSTICARCATLLLAQGVPPRVIMEILGHPQIGITMNLYSHVLPAMIRPRPARSTSSQVFEEFGGPCRI
jgi:hypothetical protein